MTRKWRVSFLYSLLIFWLVYLLQSVFFPKLIIRNHTLILKKKPIRPLRFRSDGTFKILQVADMHYGNGLMTRCRDVLASEFEYCSDLNTTQFVHKMIEIEKPDFLAFTGDNIYGSSASDAAESLFEAFDPAIRSRIPWAAILGNHDQESTLTRAELMYLISLMDYSVSQINPSDASVDGFGNYDIRIFGAPGSHLANTSVLNLFFLDSGDISVVEGTRTYGWIKESQLQWLRGISQEQKQDFSRSLDIASPSALTFFHIPIPEIRLLYNQPIVGRFQEAVACSIFNSGVLESLVSMGDVRGVFIGHDHDNDFCGNIKGIWFCYGGGCGYHGYGKVGWERRARIVLIELGKQETEFSGVEKIKTWKRLDDQKLTKIDEQVLWEQESSI